MFFTAVLLSALLLVTHVVPRGWKRMHVWKGWTAGVAIFAQWVFAEYFL